MYQLSVIDKNLDISLHVDVDELLAREEEEEAPSQLTNAKRPTAAIESITSSIFQTPNNSLSFISLPETAAYTPEIIIPNGEVYLASNKVKLPTYIPPAKETLNALMHVSTLCDLVYGTELDSKYTTKPELPIVKTNTALCNYMHKLYLYKFYINSQCEVAKHHRHSQSINGFISNGTALKHYYDPRLSSKLATKMASHNRDERGSPPRLSPSSGSLSEQGASVFS